MIERERGREREREREESFERGKFWERKVLRERGGGRERVDVPRTSESSSVGMFNSSRKVWPVPGFEESTSVPSRRTQSVYSLPMISRSSSSSCL